MYIAGCLAADWAPGVHDLAFDRREDPWPFCGRRETAPACAPGAALGAPERMVGVHCRAVGDSPPPIGCVARYDDAWAVLSSGLAHDI